MTSFSPWLAQNLPLLMLWAGALATLGLYTVLYKENPIYRLFEHIFLGLATGYLISETWNSVLLPKWWVPMWDGGNWWFLFCMSFGLLYYFIYSRRHNWIARLIIGFFLGVTSGQAFQAYVNDSWPQIPGSFKPVLPHDAYTTTVRADGGPDMGLIAKTVKVDAVTWPDAINNLIFMLIIVCVLSYFFFSFEQKNVVIRRSAQLGRWMMMFTFGAIFGATIMARLALLIDRMDFLLNDFGTHLPGGPPFMFLILVGLTVLALFLALRPGARSEDDRV